MENLLFRLLGIFKFEDVYIQGLSMLAHVTQDNRTRFVQMRIWISSVAVHIFSPVWLLLPLPGNWFNAL